MLWGAGPELPRELADTLDRANGDLGHWAAFYHGIGLPKTLQVGAEKKIPQGPWKSFVETDPTEAQRTAWFAKGVASGICALLDGSGYVVLDCDGPSDEIDALLKKYGIEIPHATPTVQSGSGRSRHYWFRTSRHIGRKIALATLDGREAKEGGTQLDLLGTGVVMLPPSPHPVTGQPYRWSPPILEQAHVPDLPSAVLALLDRPPSQPRLKIVDDAAIPQGQRETRLCSILGAARRQGATVDALRALGEVTNRRCQPPLASPDLDRLAQSIARYPVEETIDVDQLLARRFAEGPDRPSPTELFQTPRDLETTSAIDFVVPPYLVAGAITDLSAAPKAGKTRLRNYFMDCAVRGLLCLGYPPAPAAPVVLLTEEPPQSLREGLVAAGLMDRSDLFFLTLFNGRNLTWPEMVGAAQARAHEKGARLLIVDTVPALARLEGEAENSAGHNLAALRPLQEAAGSGLAVLTIRHDRKSGGSLVDRGRGSSAWSGGCDVLLGLSRPKGASYTTRLLEAIGRFDSISVKLQIDRTTLADGRHSFVVVGDDEEAPAPKRDRLADRLLTVLPQAEADAVTLEELAQAMDAPRRSVTSALDTVPGVQRVGAGGRSDPVRVWVLAKGESTSDPSPPTLRHNPHCLGNLLANVSGETNTSVSPPSPDPPLARTPARAPPGCQDNARRITQVALTPPNHN